MNKTREEIKRIEQQFNEGLTNEEVEEKLKNFEKIKELYKGGYKNENTK